jgi:heme exporter protein B
VLAVSRSFARERDNDAFRAVLGAPVAHSAVYLGKALSTLLFLLAVEALLVPLIALFFHLDLLAVGAPLAAIVLLGTLGFVAAGTLFGAMGVRTGARELVLAIVLFPLLAPALLSGVVATRELLGGASLAELTGWLRILGAFDLVFIASGLALFPVLVTE